MQKRIRQLLRLSLSLALLALVLHQIGLEQMQRTFTGANPALLLLAYLCFLTTIVARAMRWQVFLRAIGLPLSLVHLLRLYFIGFFFNNAIPGGYSGDLVRMYELGRETERGMVAASTVVAERLVGLAGSALLALVVLPFAFDTMPNTLRLTILITGLALPIGIWAATRDWLLRPLWQRLPGRQTLARRLRLTEFYTTLTTFGWRTVSHALLWSFGFTLLLVATNYTVTLALQRPVPALALVVFVPIVALATMIPVTFSGVGVREGAYVALFSLIGVPASSAVVIGLCLSAFNVLGGVIGGLLWLLNIKPPFSPPNRRS